MLVGVTLKKEQQAAAAAASRRRRGGGARAGAAEGEEGDGGGVWRDAAIYSIEESLAELGRLAETAGLKVRAGRGCGRGSRARALRAGRAARRAAARGVAPVTCRPVRRGSRGRRRVRGQGCLGVTRLWSP